MLSTAEAKFLSNSPTSVMVLQKLIPHATVIQLPIDVCGCLMGCAAFKEHLSAKEAWIF